MTTAEPAALIEEIREMHYETSCEAQAWFATNAATLRQERKVMATGSVQGSANPKASVSCAAGAVGLILAVPVGFAAFIGTWFGFLYWATDGFAPRTRAEHAALGGVEIAVLVVIGTPIVIGGVLLLGKGFMSLYKRWLDYYNACRTYWTQAPTPSIRHALKMIEARGSSFGKTTPDELRAVAALLARQREEMIATFGEEPSSNGLKNIARDHTRTIAAINERIAKLEADPILLAIADPTAGE